MAVDKDFTRRVHKLTVLLFGRPARRRCGCVYFALAGLAGGTAGRYLPLTADAALLGAVVVWPAAVVLVPRFRAAVVTKALVSAPVRAATPTSTRSRAVTPVRLAHSRHLHDTVLATLTAISQGGLDHREEQVRRRCAKDAEFLRQLIEHGLTDDATDLDTKLAAIAMDARDWGLLVYYMQDAIPPGIPAHVGTAVADACREALNNVVKHSGRDEAWVTVTGGTCLTVRVIDRGCGFDPAERTGFGLVRSIEERMREIGGTSYVFSTLGEGTSVELAWPTTPSAVPRQR